MFNNKAILITGGTGSFGKKFTKVILKKYKPKRLIIFSRDEQKQFQMQKDFPENNSSPIRYFIGDVRDKDRLDFALKNVDFVVHAAAMKHVPIAEYNPFEVIKTNILGAQNIIESCLKNNIEKVIALSTDKASSPINLYGATKLASDKLFINANNIKGKSKIKFSVVRYGNVMGSRGSVIPLFLNSINRGSTYVTDKRMTRFNITLNDGVDFVIASFREMWGGEIFVPKIPSYKILDLVKVVCPKNKIYFTGIRPGEKLDEEMISIHESPKTVEFKNHYVITPDLKLKNFKKDYLKIKKNCKPCIDGFSYNSRDNKYFLTENELKFLIKKNFEDFEK